MAIAKGIGATRGGVFESSFREEAELDLFAEQVVWAGLVAWFEECFALGVEHGFSPELMVLELYASGEAAEILGMMAKNGFYKQMTHHSTTSQYGTLTRAADLLNDRVLPFYEEHRLPLLRILTDRGTEYCGKAETHDYQLYLAINDIDHTKTKAKSPQTNGICERFHKTILQEFYQVTFRKKIYRDIEELQADLDQWLDKYNYERTHQGKMCCGRTPMETLADVKNIWQEKLVA